MKTDRIPALLCCLALLLCSAGCTSGTAGSAGSPGGGETPAGSSRGCTGGSGSETASPGAHVLDGETGETFRFGSLVFTMVPEEEVEKAASSDDGVPGMRRMHSILNGETRSEPFEMTQWNPCARLWISLEEDSGAVILIITKASPTAPPLGPGCTVKIPPGRSVRITCTEPLEPDLYFANFTCSLGEMAGTAVCRAAAGLEELDLQ